MPIAIYEGGSEMPIRLIDSDYWRARDIRKLNPRTRSIYNFLLQCPAGDLSGLFQFDLDEFVLQTGWKLGLFESSLEELRKAGKVRTENEDLMWVVNALHREPNKNVKVLIHCCKQLNKFRRHGLVRDYVKKYSQYFEMDGDEVVLVNAPPPKRKRPEAAAGVEVDLGEAKTARKPKGNYIADAELEAWIEANLWKPYPVPKSGRGSKRKVFQRVVKIIEQDLDTKDGLVRAVNVYAKKRKDEDPKYTMMCEGFFNPDHERWRELGASMPDERADEQAKAARQHEATELQEQIAAGLCKTMPGAGDER